jgi:hypothetical protein
MEFFQVLKQSRLVKKQIWLGPTRPSFSWAGRSFWTRCGPRWPTCIFSGHFLERKK